MIAYSWFIVCFDKCTYSTAVETLHPQYISGAKASYLSNLSCGIACIHSRSTIVGKGIGAVMHY